MPDWQHQAPSRHLPEVSEQAVEEPVAKPSNSRHVVANREGGGT